MKVSIDASMDESKNINTKKMKKAVRKLNKNSRYSYGLNIPKEFVEKYGWRGKQKLVIEDKGRGVLQIRDWRKR